MRCYRRVLPKYPHTLPTEQSVSQPGVSCARVGQCPHSGSFWLVDITSAAHASYHLRVCLTLHACSPNFARPTGHVSMERIGKGKRLFWRELWRNLRTRVVVADPGSIRGSGIAGPVSMRHHTVPVVDHFLPCSSSHIAVVHDFRTAGCCLLLTSGNSWPTSFSWLLRPVNQSVFTDAPLQRRRCLGRRVFLAVASTEPV
jgi:hypothetical protein